jgi:hypothetical protein
LAPFHVRDDLAKRLEEKTLSHEKYLRLCKQHGVQYPDLLLDYLHKSGFLFLFYYPGRFGNVLILDQHWIINIVYRLFDPAERIRNRLYRQSGKFTGADIQDFWPEHDEAEREVFLDYLLGCEMIFALDKSWSTPFAEQQFVLPAMLPREPPPGVKRHRETPQNNEWWLDFSHRFLHRGLIERLIVRTAHLSPEQDWWRDGILLQDPDSQCWLLLDYQPNSSFKNAKNTIRLRIGGGQKEQKARARDKVQNLLQELHPQNPPTIFVSPNGEHFVCLEEVEKGELQVITREGKIVDSTDYQAFRRTVDPKQRFDERPAPSEAPVRIFISSSSKDIEYRKRLKKCIKAIEGILSIPIDCWDDSHIRPGEWETQIYSKLIKANIICLLIS